MSIKRKNVYLLCGIPGSGKSTWAQQQIKINPYSTWISRDIIRFSIVDENEDYFSKENEVFNEFIRHINEAIILYDNIYIDATHINAKSRNKVLSRLNLENCNVIPVNFIISLKTAIYRNNKREGRQNVPTDVIRRMFYQFHPAITDENSLFTEILNIKEVN